MKDPYRGWWALTLDEKIVGFIVILLQPQESQLMNIAVNPTYQKNGFAKYLLQEAIHVLKTKQVTKMLLEVRNSNKSAIGFYKKFGGVKIGVRKNYYLTQEGREDAIVFVFNF